MNKTVLKWHGGKAYLANWILSKFPDREFYITYAEPYFGGGSVLFAHNPEGKSEIVNDINDDLMVFWRVLQNDLDFHNFQRYIEATPFSQKEFLREDRWPQDIVWRAVDFFVRNRQSRQGLMKDFATMSKTRVRRGMNEQVSSWLSAVEGLPEFHNRIKRVVIFNEDAIRFIKRIDNKKTLFYLDPPYLPDTRTHKNSYKHEMTVDQHIELLSTLSKIKGKFLLSGNPSDLYNNFASKNNWNLETTIIDNKSSSDKSKKDRTECLWMNY